MIKGKTFFGLLVLTILLITILILNNDRKLKSYYDSTIEIMKEDSLNLKVTKVWINRGYVYFNDSLDFRGDILNSNIDINDLFNLSLPFYLNKSFQNDTIWILSNNAKYFFVLN